MADQAVRIERLVTDGATLLVLPDPSLPVVRFMVCLRHGAVVDPAGQAGRCRVLLELLTRGTTAHSRVDWNAALERLGSQVGTSLGSDLGIFHGLCLRRHLGATLGLVGEALLHPAFAEHERHDLVTELCAQLDSERDDDEMLLELFWRRSLYRDHPLWRRPTGEPEQLQTLVQEHVRAGYQAHLAKEELLFAFAGDITAAEAAELVAPWLAALPPRSALPSNLPAPVGSPGLEIVVVDKPERTQAQLCVGRLALAGNHPDTYAFWLGATAFGGTFTSPFTREVRDARGWSYTAQAEYARRKPYRVPLVLRTAPAIEDAVDCLELELSMYRHLARGELEPSAIEFARSYLLNRYPLEVATSAELLLPAVRNDLLGLPPDELFRVPQVLEGLTPPLVQAALARHLDPESVLVVMVATASLVVDELQTRFPSAHLRVVDFRDGRFATAME
jgi:zinc protease